MMIDITSHSPPPQSQMSSTNIGIKFGTLISTIWLRDGTETVTTNLGQVEPESYGNEFNKPIHEYGKRI